MVYSKRKNFGVKSADFVQQLSETEINEVQAEIIAREAEEALDHVTYDLHPLSVDSSKAPEYQLQRLLREVTTRTDEELQKLIADANARIEEFRQDIVKTFNECTLEELVWCIEELSLSSYEWIVLGVLIDKRLAETELQRRN